MLSKPKAIPQNVVTSKYKARKDIISIHEEMGMDWQWPTHKTLKYFIAS